MRPSIGRKFSPHDEERRKRNHTSARPGFASEFHLYEYGVNQSGPSLRVRRSELEWFTYSFGGGSGQHGNATFPHRSCV